MRFELTKAHFYMVVVIITFILNEFIPFLIAMFCALYKVVYIPYQAEIYIHTTHALSPKGYQRHLRYSSETPTFYQNLATIGKPIAV
jgi:hypothetical protein